MPQSHSATAAQCRRWLALVCVIATNPLSALSPDDAAHLILRTGFGPDAALARQLAPLERGAAVDALLDAMQFDVQHMPPAWTDQPPPPRQLPATLNDTEQAALKRTRNRERRLRREALKAWYVVNAAAAPSALAERLVLFWHNVFSVR
ncbi:MAG: DUF1800 family protein, partial [Pseudomonadota bacterium]